MLFWLLDDVSDGFWVSEGWLDEIWIVEEISR